MTEFVREHLRALSPYASLAADIQRHAVEHFGLQFATPQQRTRTPSVFKWLINERAALAGEAEGLQREPARLQAELPGVDVSTRALQVATALGVELPTKKDFSTFRRDYHAGLKVQ